MPPPKPEVELPEIVEPEMVSEVPWLKIPPPPDAEFPVIVEAEIKSEPKLLKAPPKPELFAPDTVTPEIVRLPKLATEKTLKLPLLALMLRVFAPGPVMVRVPAEVVEAMVGRDCNTLSRVIVPVTLKSIISLAEVRLAVVIASLSEIPI